MNTHEQHTWVIVLAAGEGSRLRSLTMGEFGVPVPKQFCSLCGGRSLLREALERAGRIAAPQRTCIVVVASHRRWWSPELATAPAENIIVQPRNRGTANGILLPLLHILERDPLARIVVLPSDHHVADEERLAGAIRGAIGKIDAHGQQVHLLGICPDEADPDLGYILPGRRIDDEVMAVTQFVEKPTQVLARLLIAAGALWNAFIFCASAQTLLGMFTRRFPSIVADMRAVIAQASCASATPEEPEEIADLYQDLPDIDFSRQVLQASENMLRVFAVPCCGWSDLGTPRHLAATLRRMRAAATGVESSSPPFTIPSLAAEHARRESRGGLRENESQTPARFT